ncbi:MAG: GNAT family N-acetyltransferase [Bacteroidales bacterium]|nr:GNAT family N-acetyltransferase [Bacteroidales bacterium]
MNNIEIIECDFSHPDHLKAVGELTAAYMNDPMGGHIRMDDKIKSELPIVLAKHPAKLVLLAKAGNNYVGICTAFIGISTFYARPFFNVHDIAVLSEYRGRGIGQKLLEKVIDIARKHNYCKITLEVRHDNVVAQKLYQKLGFANSEPPMYFWTKWL